MSSFWDEWFERFSRSRGFFFPDLKRIIKEMEREVGEAFREMEIFIPRERVRIKRLLDGSVRREFGPFVYCYSMRIGPDGRPIIREFGNIRPVLVAEGRPHLNLQDWREPLVDIIEEDDELKVIVELPGVDKNAIKLFATPRTIKINVDTHERKYHKKVDLNVEVDESSVRSRYRNGVLEITLKKKEQGKDTRINIE